MSSLYAAGLTNDKQCGINYDAGQFDASEIDLCFAGPRWSGWYSRLPDSLAHKALDHLGHKVSRRPENLSAHLHRIIAAWNLKRGEVIYSALLDLFIVLDKKGFALRQRMLNKVAPQLTSAQRTALRQGLLFGISSVDKLPLCYSSRLNKGLCGGTALVVQTNAQPESEFSILDEARDLIDSGLLDEARVILEQAVEQQPGDESLNRELLALYRYTKDGDALLAASERFAGLDLALKQQWTELAELLWEKERMVG
jgi:hypothetical protein